MAAKFKIFVKGTKKTAQRAAARRGISARCNLSRVARDGVDCEVPCRDYSKVVRWFAEKKSVKRGRGELPGALLFYGGCPKGEFRGGVRRRKKRRRR